MRRILPERSQVIYYSNRHGDYLETNPLFGKGITAFELQYSEDETQEEWEESWVDVDFHNGANNSYQACDLAVMHADSNCAKALTERCLVFPKHKLIWRY